MKAHPLAELFPLMEGKVFEDLCADIKKNGLIEPIVTLDDMILDGRNRQRACEQAGIPPYYVRFDQLGGADATPWEYVAAKNLLRRDLTADQRAMIATRMDDVVSKLKAEAKARQRAAGGRKPPLAAARTQAPGKGKRNPSTRDQLAKIGRVSTRKIRQAEKVKRSPKRQELEPQVLAGSKTLAQAVKEVAPPSAKPSRSFDVEAEVRLKIGMIEGSFERCPPELRAQYKQRLQEGLAQMWSDENWLAGNIKELFQNMTAGKVTVAAAKPALEAALKDLSVNLKTQQARRNALIKAALHTGRISPEIARELRRVPPLDPPPALNPPSADGPGQIAVSLARNYQEKAAAGERTAAK
jgi:ParB-like chromosome segregation protein Spo0J